MKCAIILVAICLAVVYAKEGGKKHEESPEEKQWKEECAKDNNIDLAALKPKKGDKGKKPEITKDFKCFKKCMATKRGLIDANGNPNYEDIQKRFKLNDTMIASVKNCTSTAEDACDKYFEMESCAWKIVGHKKCGKKDKKEEKEKDE